MAENRPLQGIPELPDNDLPHRTLVRVYDRFAHLLTDEDLQSIQMQYHIQNKDSYDKEDRLASIRNTMLQLNGVGAAKVLNSVLDGIGT